MKIRNLKVMQALQVGTYAGETYFKDDKFDVEFVSPVTIRVTSKRDAASGAVTASKMTTIYNAIEWQEIEGEEPLPAFAPRKKPAPIPPAEAAVIAKAFNISEADPGPGAIELKDFVPGVVVPVAASPAPELTGLVGTKPAPEPKPESAPRRPRRNRDIPDDDF